MTGPRGTWLLVLLLAPLLVSPSRAQPLFQVHASTRQVTALARAGDSLLLGTTGGLVVHHPESGRTRHHLRGAWIRALGHDTTDPSACLVATPRGLLRFHDGNLETLSELPTTSVLALPSRRMLLTGHPNGVVRWLREDGEQRLSKLPTRSPVLQLMVHDHRVWAGNSEGLWSLDRAGTARRERVSPLEISESVTWIGVHDETLLVGTPGGLFARRETSWQRRGPAIHVLGAGPLAGELLVGTRGDGTWILRQGVLEPFSHALPRATAFLGVDQELLVGTADRGVLLLDPRAHRSRGEGITPFHAPVNELPENSVTALTWVARQEALYAGTFERGVGRLRHGVWTRQGVRTGLPSEWVNHLASDGERVLIRVSDGRVALSRQPRSWSPLGRDQGWPKDWTASLGEDRGMLWVGSLSAFYLSPSPGSWQVFRPKPALDQRLVLDVARFQGRLWVATHRAGLISLDPATGDWERVSLGTGLAGSWVTAVEVFGGALWAGTFRGGLSRLRSREHPWEPVDPGEALPSRAIHCLLGTPEELWVGTMEGLARHDGDSWAHYGVGEGLPSGNVTALAASDAALWVGTPSGLAQGALPALREHPAGAPGPSSGGPGRGGSRSREP